VAGDVDSGTIKTKLEKAFANWKPGEIPAAKDEVQTMKAKPGVYIVDKPGSVQSSVFIGQASVPRTTPDYYALQVMNKILGGGFSGRLFMNLREDKGYTYGVYSGFAFRKGGGAFSASGDMQTSSTKEAIQELLKELNGIRGAIPITAAELDANKQSLIRRFPADFETPWQISNQLADLVKYNLSDTYFNDYISKIGAVTRDDVNRVANKYLDPSKMAIVIVGDRKAIEPGLKELGYAISILDVNGNPVAN
jgi:zinc protease